MTSALITPWSGRLLLSTCYNGNLTPWILRLSFLAVGQKRSERVEPGRKLEHAAVDKTPVAMTGVCVCYQAACFSQIGRAHV